MAHRTSVSGFLRPLAAMLLLGLPAGGGVRPAAGGEALEQGLIGLWQFDTSDGKTVRDRSPRHNDGTIDGGTLRPEKAGRSLELDGLGSHVSIPEKTPWRLERAVSAALWVRADDLRHNMVLFGVPNSREDWTTPVFGMYLERGSVVWGLWGDRGVAKMLLSSSALLPVESWTLLVGTFDGATARLYVNGGLAAEKAHAGRVAHNGLPLLIGKGAGYSKPSLRGRVGELRLWDRGLSAAEVRRLYEQTRGGYDLGGPPPAPHKDGTVTVESPGSNPGNPTWRSYPTRLLELLDGYRPQGAPPPLNGYGGRTDRPRELATGFFRVTRLDGRFWLIDPEGCRYYNIGMNAVSPPRGFAKEGAATRRWAEQVTATLRGAHFNGLGNWQGPVMTQVPGRLPWVLRWDFMFSFAREKKLTEPAAGTQGFLQKCMPVFHPDFPAHCERYAAGLAATADDPLLVGIMTDNELQCPANLLDRYLGLDASHADLKPGRDAAAAWLKARRGNDSTEGITTRERYEFIAFAFEQYYRIVVPAIRKFDRNHLYLGSRINYHVAQFDNPWFWKMLAKYHDVVSVNYYAQWGPNRAQLQQWARWCDRPVLLTEWYAKAQDVAALANTHGAGWLVRTQEDRARYYQHFALGALETPTIIGWHWFKYRDDPAESVALDSAGGANKGMFDLSDRPYAPLLERATAVNREAYHLIEFFDARGRK